ncbi:hypothetical protein [Terrarubrum flagellatum]|uniref:hypothetical protein n=1 Tax=Terrirubrum flagellatum TaxID=2895980 RepID=UPI0031451EEF
MSLIPIILRRQRALIDAWARNPLIQVQVEAPQALPGLVFIEDGGDGASVGALGRRNAQNVAMVQRGANIDSDWSVWVAAGYSGYRSAYVAFARSAYGVNATIADLAGYDVDHMLNRARSPQDSTFIRIEAIPAAANQEWGRLFEKAASNPQFYANQKRERRTMSWVICAKLAGEAPPTGPNDAAGINRLVNFFTTIGLSANEARDGLNSMLSFAYKFR